MAKRYATGAVVAAATTVAVALSCQPIPAQTARSPIAPGVTGTIAPTETPQPGRPARPADRINANALTVIAGSPEGSWLTVAADLAAVLDDGDNLRIIPMLGKGALQNVRDVMLMKGVDIGITVTPVLGAFRDAREFGGAIDDRLVYITKLFEDELHLVVHAGSGITALDQLRGRKVNFSEAGSGTQWLMRDLFGRLGLDVREVNMSQGEALDRMRTGEVAATIMVSAVPTPVFARLRGSDSYRLIAVPFFRQVHEDYLPTTLSADDYPGLIPPGGSVETLAVSAVMVTYNWPRNSERYRRTERFVDALFSNIAQFGQPRRFPKWRDVNITAVLPGWKRSDAAQDWLQRHGLLGTAVPARVADTRAQADPTIRAQFDAFISSRAGQGATLTAEQRARLYGEFLEWSRTHDRP